MVENSVVRVALDVAVLGWVLIGGVFIGYRLAHHYQRTATLRHRGAG